MKRYVILLGASLVVAWIIADLVSQYLAIPYEPPNGVVWISRIEMECIIAKLDRIPEWRKAGVPDILRKQMRDGSWKVIDVLGYRFVATSPWLLVDLDAYSAWHQSLSEMAARKP